MAGSVLQGNGLNPSLINLNGDRSLQKCYRQDETLMPSETQQDPLDATKRAVLNSYPMADPQERPGLAR
jgi:hypothetical protein